MAVKRSVDDPRDTRHVITQPFDSVAEPWQSGDASCPYPVGRCSNPPPPQGCPETTTCMGPENALGMLAVTASLRPPASASGRTRRARRRTPRAER
jgi:hypothetical protein